MGEALRKMPALVGAGARNTVYAVRDYRTAADLGPGVDVDVRAKEIIARVGVINRRIGWALVGAWTMAGLGAVALHGWTHPAGAAVVAVGAFVVSPASNIRREFKVKGDAGSFGWIYAVMAGTYLATAWPVVLTVASLTLWWWAGPAYLVSLAVTAALVVLAGLGALAAMAWRDGSVRDNLGLTGPKMINPDLVQQAVASAVLGAAASKLVEVASTVRLATPIVTLPDGGWRTTVLLPGSATAENAVKKQDGIASFLEIPKEQLTVVQGSHDGEIQITAYPHDPYARGGAPSPLAVTPKVTSIWDPIRIGATLDGQPVTVPLPYSGVLIGGRPRTGKTVTEMAFLAHALLDPGTDTFIGDGKEVDTWPARGLVAGYVGADLQGFADMLDVLLDRIFSTKTRCRDLGLKRLTRQACEQHRFRPAVLFTDELAYYTRATSQADKVLAEEIMEKLARIVEYGPAFGVWVVLATQYPRGDVIDPRIRQIPVRIALPTSDRQASDLILGEGSNARGHRSHLFPAGTVGVAVVKAATTGTVLIDDFDTEDDLDKVVAFAEGLRDGLGMLPAPVEADPVLAACSMVFEAEGVDRLSRTALAAHLGITEAVLVNDLSKRGIKNEPRRFADGTQARGYLASQFEAVPTPVPTLYQPRTSPVPDGAAEPVGTGWDGGRYGANVIPIRGRYAPTERRVEQS